MAEIHRYFVVEDIPPGWTREDREIAYQALRGHGRQDDPLPARITHTRERLDGKGMLVEMVLDDGEYTVDGIAQIMADVLQANPTAIKNATTITLFDAEGIGPDREPARLEAITFLRDNAAEWQSEDI